MTHASNLQPASDVPLTLRLFVNGEPVQVAPTSLAQWLSDAGMAQEKVATAINGDFVARDQRETRMLVDGDRLDVFRAIVGG